MNAAFVIKVLEVLGVVAGTITVLGLIAGLTLLILIFTSSDNPFR